MRCQDRDKNPSNKDKRIFLEMSLTSDQHDANGKDFFRIRIGTNLKMTNDNEKIISEIIHIRTLTLPKPTEVNDENVK